MVVLLFQNEMFYLTKVISEYVYKSRITNNFAHMFAYHDIFISLRLDLRLSEFLFFKFLSVAINIAET